jgi:hypothetical protein
MNPAPALATLRRALLLLGILGAASFAAAFAWSFAQPLGTERLLRQLVQREVQQRVEARIDSVAEGGIATVARRALGRNDAEIDVLQRRLREASKARVDEVVVSMLQADCDCRQRIAGYLREARQARLDSLVEVRTRLVALAESAYARVSRELLHEFRIFTASNAIAFGLLAFTAWRRRSAGLQLALPALAIAGAIALAGSLYLFNQDWLHTIVFGDYLGWGYAAWLAVVASLLGDVLLNRARVSTRLANLGLNAVGATASAVPC